MNPKKTEAYVEKLRAPTKNYQSQVWGEHHEI
jgi:hypothetical protein